MTTPDIVEQATIRPRGEWARTTIYSPLDVVTHSGSSYIALTENIGTEPTWYSAEWQTLAERGQPGPALNLRGPWDPRTIYEPFDVVSYNGSSWIARKPSINVRPAENEFWMLLAERGKEFAGPVGVAGVGPAGPQGDPGDPGPQNLFVQETDPGMTSPGLWIQLWPDGTVRTFWAENGLP